LFTLAFWRAAAERAVKTFAQSLAALLVADGTDLLTTNWGDRLSVSGMAAVVSVLTSVASGVTGAGPSVGNAETLNPAAPEKAVAVPEAKLPTTGDSIDGGRSVLLSNPPAGDYIADPSDDKPTPLGYWGGV
jgi:hypothetical protein